MQKTVQYVIMHFHPIHMCLQVDTKFIKLDFRATRLLKHIIRDTHRTNVRDAVRVADDQTVRQVSLPLCCRCLSVSTTNETRQYIHRSIYSNQTRNNTASVSHKQRNCDTLFGL